MWSSSQSTHIMWVIGAPPGRRLVKAAKFFPCASSRTSGSIGTSASFLRLYVSGLGVLPDAAVEGHGHAGLLTVVAETVQLAGRDEHDVPFLDRDGAVRRQVGTSALDDDEDLVGVRVQVKVMALPRREIDGTDDAGL